MDCICLGAGTGTRFKKKVPKQFFKLLGKPILIYSLEILENIDEIDRVFLTYHSEFKDLYEQVIKDYNISKITLVNGGETRQKSVFLGLQHVESERLLIHEAARPFITKDFILNLLKFKDKAVIPTVPIPFTVSMGKNYMSNELDRSQLHNVQLPQVFDKECLISAHIKAQQENYTATEDGILVFRLNEKVKFVKGMENNIKITTPLDLIVAEHLMRGINQ